MLFCLFDILPRRKVSEDEDTLTMPVFSAVASLVVGLFLYIFVAQFIPHVVTAFIGGTGRGEYTVYDISYYKSRHRATDRHGDVIFSFETSIPPFDNLSIYGKRGWAVVNNGDVVTLTGKKSLGWGEVFVSCGRP
ncbi:MAG: hypothetical protein ACI9EW_003097, partial [Cellvibrionaceae bacterium]